MTTLERARNASGLHRHTSTLPPSDESHSEDGRPPLGGLSNEFDLSGREIVGGRVVDTQERDEAGRP